MELSNNKARLGILFKRPLSFRFSMALFLGVVSLILCISYKPTNVCAVTSTLTINVTDSVSLDIASSGTSATFAHSDTTTPNISVRTTNGSGYTLGIRANTSGANNNALINTSDATKFIPSITTSGGISESTYSSSSSYNNTWGYRPSKLNSSTNSNYLPAPNSNTTPVILDQTSTSNPSANNTYNIALGVRIDGTTVPGSYANTFVITVTANSIPYTITYNRNTTDNVTNMPNNESSTTYSETVMLSNQVPVRDGYNFKGWCTAQIADDTACTGTTYNPDGDGTNLTWTTNQTLPSNSLTIYAMWETSSTISCNPNGTTIGTNTSSDIKCMQDFASLSSSTKTTLINSMTTGTQYTLADKRDGKTYIISKFANGKVWMAQNLDLDLDSNTTYTNLDTDLGWNTSTNSYQTASWSPLRSTYGTTSTHTHQWCQGGIWDSYVGRCSVNNTPESYDPGELYWNETESDFNDWTIYNNSCDNSSGTPVCDQTKNPISNYISTSSSTPQYYLGNLYNWAAAVATNDGSSFNTPVEQSICPSGWTLPKSGSGANSFYSLWNQYGFGSSSRNGNNTLWGNPLYFNVNGTFDGKLNYVGFVGGFWLSNPADTYTAGCAYFYVDGTAQPSDYDGRYYGNSVRCMVR